MNGMTEKATDHRGCLAKGFPFWNDLTPEEQEMLCRYTRPVHYAKGARVHSPLESCVGILLLRSGQLRAYLLSEDGRDVTLYRLFGGEVCILSASCVMDSVNIDLYIDAEEDTEAYCISAGIFRRLMQQNVHVRCYAYQMTAERFSDSMWTMQQVLFMSADRRLAIFLTDELAKTGGDEVRMTHDQMAKYMGSAREVVSRMLKYFAQEGWVRLFRGGVQVLDRKKTAAAGKRRITKKGRCDVHIVPFLVICYPLQPCSSQSPKSLASAILVGSNFPLSSLGATAGPASTGFGLGASGSHTGFSPCSAGAAGAAASSAGWAAGSAASSGVSAAAASALASSAAFASPSA